MIALRLDDDALEPLAQRVAEILAEKFHGEPTSPYLTVAEASEYLRCSRQAVYDRVHQGALEPCRDGKRLLFRRSDLDAYLTEGAS